MFCKKRPATLLEGWSRVAKFLRKPTLKNVFEWLHPEDGDKLGFYKKVHIKITSEGKDISDFLVIFVLFIYLFIYLFILSLMLTITEKILFTIKIAVKC